MLPHFASIHGNGHLKKNPVIPRSPLLWTEGTGVQRTAVSGIRVAERVLAREKSCSLGKQSPYGTLLVPFD